MSSERRLVIIFMGALLALVMVAVYLLQRNVEVDAYSDRMVLLQEAGRLDARLDEDLQRVLSLQLLHYDTLMETTIALRENAERIAGPEQGLRGSIDAPGFDALLDDYQQAVGQKIQMLERIKSRVALLRNSLHYLPALLEQLTGESSHEQLGVEQGLLSALLEYHLFPGDENYRNLLDEIAELTLPVWEQEKAEFLDQVLLHLTLSVSLRTEIDEMVREYRTQQSPQLLQQLREVFSGNYQRQTARFYNTSRLLFVLLFVLFLGMGYLMLSLHRARRSSEQTLQQLHDAVESISEPFVSFDAGDRLLLWNRKYAELYPASAALLEVGTPFAELARLRVENGDYPEDELEELQLTKLLEHHSNTEKAEVETLADGRHYLVSNSRTSEGGIASVFVDITERLETEEQLGIAAAVFDTSSEGIVVTDHNNCILAVNPGFTQITGYRADEVVGKSPNLLSSGRHDAEFYSEMWRSLYDNDIWEGEIWNRNKFGEVYAEWLSLTLVRDERGDVVQHIAVFSDITKRKQDEEKIRWQANYDAVTSLPNRTLFTERLKASISSSHREEWVTALLFIDLDHFKMVNDTRGHAVGDWLLQEVAGRLAACVREADTVARLGGDEFTVILQDVGDADSAARVAQKIVETLAEPFFAEGGDIYIGGSIGITLYPNDAWEDEELVRNADLAMYRAKEAGRGRYRFFTQSMNDQIQARSRMEDDMRLALQQDEFFLEYQPIVDARSGEVAHAEALVRWQHPMRGRVSPFDFISVAEDSGLIAPLGWWVLEEACSQAAIWHKRGYHIGVSVNISAKQIRLGLNVEDIVSLLEEVGLPPQYLTLEITEGLLLEKTEKTLRWLNHVREMGIKLSVDDFGTGFSSLSYLKRFPVNTLKIDQSFVRNLTTDKEDAELTRAIIGLAQTFNLEVIAEGVEEVDQLTFLKQNGCHFIQGYHYSRPLGAAAFSDYFQQSNQSVIVKLDEERGA